VLANARILRESGFRRIWIQPAAGDAGGCLGAATYLYHTVLGHPRTYQMDTAYLGPSYSNAEIHAFLKREGIAFTVLEERRIAPTVAGLLAESDVVGWFQGRMEFGPRALGARSGRAVVRWLRRGDARRRAGLGPLRGPAGPLHRRSHPAQHRVQPAP